MSSISVNEFYVKSKRPLKLTLLSGENGLDKRINQLEIHRPGLALTGFVDIFSYERIQVLGNTEIAYLESLTEKEREVAFNRLTEFEMPCIVITNQNKSFKGLINLCNDHNIPVFRTPVTTTSFEQYQRNHNYSV